MKKRFWVLGLIFCSLWAVSCEEDDVCVGEGTPFLTVVFKNSIDENNLTDSIFIESLGQGDEVLGTVIPWAVTDSIKLPLGGLDDNTSRFRIQRKSAGIPDILTVNYNTQSNYVSKACGFRITYDNLNYTSTENDIQNLVPSESNELENESTTNLYIYYTNF